jgi:CRISPR/Cas system-associated exonuclease Cas4 (RecB family)
MKINGIPDAIFEDPRLNHVVFEVKTGAPSAEKVENYKDDLLWYKLLAERHFIGVDKIEITHGKIYFPIDNSEYLHELKDEDIDQLLKKIEQTRNSIIAEDFRPLPELSKCSWCGFRKVCEHSRF